MLKTLIRQNNCGTIRKLTSELAHRLETKQKSLAKQGFPGITMDER